MTLIMTLMNAMLNYFELFMTETFLNLIVTQLNVYASQNKQELCLTIVELKAIIGILIIMDFNVLPSMRLYWSDNENFHNSKISDIMIHDSQAFFKNYKVYSFER